MPTPLTAVPLPLNWRMEREKDAAASPSPPFEGGDPNDRGMLDVVGFDTTVPAVIADFVRS